MKQERHGTCDVINARYGCAVGRGLLMTTICLLLYMLIRPWSRIRSLGWMASDRLRSARTARTFSSIPRWFSPLTIRNAPFSPQSVPQLFKQICNNIFWHSNNTIGSLRDRHMFQTNSGKIHDHVIHRTQYFCLCPSCWISSPQLQFQCKVALPYNVKRL